MLAKISSGTFFRGRHKRNKENRDEETSAKRGRPSLVSKFPDIIPVAQNFIESNGFEAHNRRHNTTGNCGVSLKMIQSHILREVDNLKEEHPNFSTNTVHRMLKAPHEGRKNAHRYKEYIDAKVPRKENSRMKSHVNEHFCNARVKYALQFNALYPNQCALYSLDNKNKIKIGTDVLAVDRRTKIRKIFPADDRPNYLDHDFPSRNGNLITPCGYLRLTLHNPPKKSTDKYGRFELEVQRSGPVKIVQRGPATKCTVASHVNDMRPLIEMEMREGKSIITLISDGGCDFNTGHNTNLLYYGRLFKDTNIDALFITCYAPGQSAYNSIEHVWGVCTQVLTSVSLPHRLEGEEISPWEQRGLTEDERREKSHTVYDNAMSKLNRYLDGVTFAGYPISTSYIASDQQEMPYAHSDYTTTYDVMSSNSGRKFQESELVDEVRFMLKHIDRRKGFTAFYKCTDDGCNHCTLHPVIAKEPLDKLRSNGGFPSPMLDESREHFYTLHDVWNFESWDTNDVALPNGGLGKCQICPSYTLLSAADVTAHRRKYHPRQRIR